MNCARPSSEEDLDGLLRIAYGHACKGNYEEALAICNWLIADESTELAGYRQRAAVKEHMADVASATLDLQYVVSRSAHEPADFYALGILLLQGGATSEAIDAFGRAVEIGAAENDTYYTNASLLFRAEAFLKRADFDEAFADAARLPDGYRTHIPGSGMRSKEEIASEATAAIGKKARNKFRSPF
jgi:tetratricopeptide (TPR) repeat protein